MSTDLVKRFNALRRTPKTPSGRVPNEWHFDVRYVQLEPTPSHVIALIQPQSHYVHMERLPAGVSPRENGMEFFPDTAKEAATGVAKGLLHAFVDNMSLNKMMGATAPPPFAPWKLTTDDKTLALAVGNEFKRLGVQPGALHKIGMSTTSTVDLMQTEFDRLFASIKNAIGYTDPPRSSIGEQDSTEEDRLAQLRLDYVNLHGNATPFDGEEYDATTYSDKLIKRLDALSKQLEEKPERVLNSAADRGDPEAALDYGIRLSIGLGCTRNRKRCREYLIKAAYSEHASDTVKATAHGLLINWYIDSSNTDLRSRYIFGAAHHANASAALCHRITPSGAHSSGAVLFFMSRLFVPFSEKAPELYLHFKDAVKALEERNKQMEAGTDKMLKKRLRKPIRYRCAAVGCGIEADTGTKLLKCSGPCDADKKPNYCSRECQKADWKIHKPFCRPGAECSVVDDTATNPANRGAPSSKSVAGALQISIKRPDGSEMTFSSSTMDAKTLKEFKELSEKDH